MVESPVFFCQDVESNILQPAFFSSLGLEEKMDCHTDHIWIRCRNNLIILAHKTLFK